MRVSLEYETKPETFWRQEHDVRVHGDHVATYSQSHSTTLRWRILSTAQTWRCRRFSYSLFKYSLALCTRSHRRYFENYQTQRATVYGCVWSVGCQSDQAHSCSGLQSYRTQDFAL